MAEMTFWDHLDELRKVLFRVVGVCLVYFIFRFVHTVFETFYTFA